MIKGNSKLVFPSIQVLPAHVQQCCWFVVGESYSCRYHCISLSLLRI